MVDTVVESNFEGRKRKKRGYGEGRKEANHFGLVTYQGFHRLCVGSANQAERHVQGTTISSKQADEGGRKIKKRAAAKTAKQPVPAVTESENEGKKGYQYDIIYQDGMTVWVNHPTLSSAGDDTLYALVGRKVKDAAKAAHPTVIIVFTRVNRTGPHATYGTARVYYVDAVDKS